MTVRFTQPPLISRALPDALNFSMPVSVAVDYLFNGGPALLESLSAVCRLKTGRSLNRQTEYIPERNKVFLKTKKGSKA